MNKTVLERILDALREFRRVHQREPMVLHLTPEDESKIARLGWNELGTVLELVLRDGPRKALPTLYGLKVMWDSKQFSLE
jgi:hypothetical protein